MNKEEIYIEKGILVHYINEIEYYEYDTLYEETLEYLNKLQQENQSLKKENKILRENTEHNDKVVDKVNWENMLLKKENQELKSQLKGTTHCFDEEEHEKLKKQLEEERNKVREYSYKLSNFRCEETYENQQKEFIEYLEKTIEELESDDADDEEMKGYLIQRIDTFKENLSKFKEIIGEENDK